MWPQVEVCGHFLLRPILGIWWLLRWVHAPFVFTAWREAPPGRLHVAQRVLDHAREHVQALARLHAVRLRRQRLQNLRHAPQPEGRRRQEGLNEEPGRKPAEVRFPGGLRVVCRIDHEAPSEAMRSVLKL